MNVYLIAMMKTFDGFRNFYDKKYLNEPDDGNTDLLRQEIRIERYRVFVNYLIDEEVLMCIHWDGTKILCYMYY